MNSPNDGDRSHRGMGRVIAVLVACFALLMIAAPSALGAQQVITSAGPLNKIFLNDNLGCQANHTGDTANEFFGGSNPGACGTFIHTGGTVYGATVPAGNSQTPYGLVSQSAVTGSGTSSADPFKVVTVVNVGTTGLQITQTDSYVVGDEFYKTDIVVSNSTGAAITAALYHAADCFLQESDEGNGFYDSSGGGIYCSKNVNNTPPGRIEGFVPLSSGSNYVEIDWPSIWNIINGTQFPNSCECTTFQDNGAGLSWPLTVPAHTSVTRSLLTSFSPTGETPPQGKISARGTVQTAQGPTIGFSAITDCNPSQSTRPSIVGTTAGARIWTKTTVTQSSCTDQPPASTLGFDTQTGTATGTFGPSAPGGRNGQQGTLQWTYYDNSPDTVQFTLKDSSSTVVFQANQQTPSAFGGSPGGVWTFGP